MYELMLIITMLVWIAITVFNYWIWSKGKGKASLWMMVGAGLIALMYLFTLVKLSVGELGGWLTLIGNVLFGFGFYLSVQPQIAAQMAALKAKASNLTKADDSDGGGDKAES